ncbi:PSII_BNR domain-containing protein [Thauera humireducens]|uniref:WD40/YVTN/BNR-like repeat-containing protein n=1 Tax=Thauera humireducens TaxID=1134435 RepID=UPI002467A6FB|nr:YCF48-related protein [Thauera humireducens]CAH1749510.1 PSII_BNR domain-containing protein [Thauera humireducens]
MWVDRSGLATRVRMFAIAGVIGAVSVLAHSEASSVGKGIDLLNVPALQSEKAARALLLGVATAGSRLVAVGERGIVVTSEDQGQTWSQAQVPVSVSLTAAHFASPTLGWVVGHDGVVLKTEDGGQVWSKLLDGNRANTLVLADLKARVAELQGAVAEASGDDVERLQAALEAMQFRLEDAEAGASFGPARPLLALWFKDERLGFVVGAFGQIFRTDDGGKTWVSLAGALSNPDSLHLNSIIRLKNGTLAVVGERGTIWFSADDGASWTVSEVGYDGHLYGVIQASPDALLAFGFAGNIFRSTDDGNTWTRLDRVSEKSIVGGLADEGRGVLLVTRNGQVIESADAGESFKLSSVKTGRTVASVLPSFIDSGKSLITVGHGGLAMTRLDRAGE